MYSDGQGSGYLLMAARGGSRPGSGGDAAWTDGWTETEQDGSACWSKPSQQAGGLGVTICLRGRITRLETG